MSIKNMSIDSRPRERLELVGLSNLSNAELLAIIIGSGSKEKSAIAIANELLEKVGSIRKLSRLNLNNIKIKGFGRVKKINVSVAFELGRRAVNELERKINLKESHAIYRFCFPKYYGLQKEKISLIILDKNLNFIYEESENSGTFNDISFSMPWVLRVCSINQGPNAILIHNHPSNIPKPSAQDDVATYTIKECSKLLGVCLYDHIIISDNSYYSYRDKNRLNKINEKLIIDNLSTK